MKIVFLVGSISDSHIIRRAQSIKEAGFDVEICGFTRGVKSNNKVEGIPVNVLGEIEDQHYIKRIRKEWRAISKTISSYPKETLFYAWGFDLALFTFLKGSHYVYEISDIRHGEFGKVIGSVFKVIDRCLIKKSKATVITSEGFIEYLNVHSSNKIVLMPNQLSQMYLDMKRPMPQVTEGRIKFGFVGYYRYPNTVLKLAKQVGLKADKFEFHFYGIGPQPILEEIKKLSITYNNIFEHGPFKNPDDLPTIYSNIDIVACNYDAQGMNERIAEPNKLYESIYFNKPLVVSAGTFLGKKVDRLDCGYVIDSYKETEIDTFLNNLSKKELFEKSTTESKIPTDELVEDYTLLVNNINA